MFYWWKIHLRKNFLESLECFGQLSAERNDNGWFEGSCRRKYVLDSTKERIVRLNYSFFLTVGWYEKPIFTLSKVKIDAFNIDKMLYGIIIDLKFIWQLNHMKVLILSLYKVKIDAFNIDKMLYGIFSFSCGNTFGLSV